MVTITEERELGYSLGALEHLSKPVDRKLLLELVHEHTESGGDRHVLIVEDDESTRALLVRALKDDGWDVTEAWNGAVALERVAERRPDLILLDLMMPVMDGFEFVVELRRRDDGLTIPIVVVTAKDLTEEDRQRLNGDVERIVQKSGQTIDELLEHVRGSARRHLGRSG
jgi:adenylate cyclase